MLDKNIVDSYINRKEFKEFFGVSEDYKLESELLGWGEYNINYLFSLEDGTKRVIRFNTKSQMDLENQIGYEYNALKILEKSGRTPRVYYLDDSKSELDYGVLVMEYLPGKPLVYENDLKKAAHILADIHSVEVPGENTFVVPENPLYAMLDECENMASVYINSELGNEKTKETIKRLIENAEKSLEGEYECGEYRIINTELNSGNFLINGDEKEGFKNYLIDWEKPILGEIEQDLGHFLAPTTTFWKTDTILTREEIDEFVEEYKKAIAARIDTSKVEEKLDIYLKMTCLRGTTWCSMAWVEYQEPDRAIKNEFTYNKIKAYLEDGFLENIEKTYFR